MEEKVKIKVDYDRCQSHGECMMYAPDVFEVRDDGFLYVLQEEPPTELMGDVVAAVNCCPTQAISVEQ
ncbi:ferredoxin [Mycolicibacterium sp. XJ1819]